MDELVTIAAALGDPLRLKVLDLLAAGRSKPCCSPEHPDAPVWVCACDLTAELGGLAHSKLAYHLGQLRAAGLVREQRRGKWVYYAINEEALAAFTKSLGQRWGGDPAGTPSAAPDPGAGCPISGCCSTPE
jgi:ArsR family transcriptional regulator